MLSFALSSEKVAAALAERLRSGAPAGVQVGAEAGRVFVDAGSGRRADSAAPVILDDPQGWQAGEENQLLETVACVTLGEVQDAICEVLSTAWPVVPGDPEALAEPGARVEGGFLHLWFGNPSAPVLALAVISVDTLT